MAQFCNDSSSSPEVRLGNPLSDDSLLLDDGNTSSVWADSENEPATFFVNNSSSVRYPIHQNVDPNTDDWSRWHGNNNFHRNADPNRSGRDVLLNSSTQTRLSLSGDDADMPLLLNERFCGEELADFPSHCHTPSEVQLNDASAWKRLLAATAMCLLFMVAEIVGGHFAGSLAIMTDAAHLLSDFVGLLVSLSAVWLGQRPTTKTLSFGFHRAEVLGALFSIFVIWVLTAIFVYLAVLRVLRQEFEIHADRMIAVAVVGIVINIVMGFILHGACPQLNLHHSHSHSFGHNHLHDVNDGGDGEDISHNASNTSLTQGDGAPSNERNHNLSRKKANINVRAAAIHVLGDLIQSVGVFVSALVIKFNPDAKIADPICTFLFSIIVLATTVPLLRDTGLVLLEGFPRDIDFNKVMSVLQRVPGVRHVHSLHVWSLTVGKHALSVHLAVDSTTDRDLVRTMAQRELLRNFAIQQCTIQTEYFHESIMLSCTKCQPPVS